MSLNNIRLNNHLVSQLYPATLLETELEPHFAVPAPNNQNASAAPVEEAVAAPALPRVPPPVAHQQLNEPVADAADAASANGLFDADVPVQLTPAPVVAYGNTPSLGGNKKGILILVSNAATPFLPDSQLEFLSAIIGACRLSIADVAIVNLHHYPQPYTELLQQFGSKQVLMMGITPQQIDLPFHFPHFQVQQFDQRTYLSAYPLGQMAEDRNLKMQLWSCLKQMFGV